MILVIDNYDSFTFNLVQALEASGARLLVVRNDRIDRAGVELLAREGAPTASLDAIPGAESTDEREPLAGIVISPGPGNPGTAGVSVATVEVAAEHGIPLLGVCLGHQSFGAAFGGRVTRAPTLVHGEASQVFHDGAGLLVNLPSPFMAARYHSLCVDESSLPSEIEVTGRTEDGVVMAMRHRGLPIEGVQFHPESVLTPEGPHLLANFLRLTGQGSAGVLEGDDGVGFATRGLVESRR
ncbi:MAG: aminodeoxychorismate/anthranilate synthase component II [Candidatus Limnocylindrales bacterium]